MTLSKADIRAALEAIPAPAGGNLVSSGALRLVAICEGYVSIKLHLPGHAGPSDALDRISHAAANAVALTAARVGTPLESFITEFVDEQGSVIHTARQGGLRPAPPPVPPTPLPDSSHRPIGGLRDSSPASRGAAPTPQARSGILPGVKHVIAVGAGKGGVGKSTIALNLAVGLARLGYLVGLMDGDIYGPSVPTLLGLGGMDAIAHEGRLQPFIAHGIKAMTIGKLVDPEKPLIWRGPMAHGAFKQLAEQTSWGELDYLIIDLPPGTGDVPLTMAQLLQLTGAVIVCTPQKVAQDDAVRAAGMFRQLGITILGVVENMSYFVCEHGAEYDIFGKGGAQGMAKRLGVPFLGAVPITISLRKNSDNGDPTANFTADPLLRDPLEALARNLLSQVALSSVQQGAVRPTLTIS